MKSYLIAVSEGFNSPSYVRRKLLQAIDAGASVLAIDNSDMVLRRAFADAPTPVTWLTPVEATRRRIRNALTETSGTILFWDGRSHSDLLFDAHLLKTQILVVPVEVTRVVNRDRGEPYDQYIGRKSPWGNPFPVGVGEGRHSREEAISLFKDHFEKHILTDASLRPNLLRMRGYRIACHCKPLPCHGDVIAAYLNAIDPDDVSALARSDHRTLAMPVSKSTEVGADELQVDAHGAERDVIFISHANPEDNQFARWLALQLTREGYKVWSDLTDLLGGEDFWRNIEMVLRRRTAKFIYVLSSVSNEKEGPLNELAVARQVARSHKLEDFVIPLLLGSLDTAVINIELKRLNAIAFRNNWAPGLAQLLKKLGETSVPRTTFGPASLTSWWKSKYSTSHLVVNAPDVYFSNHFSASLPASIYLHRLLPAPNTLQLSGDVPAWRLQGEYIYSFAGASELRGHVPTEYRLTETRQVALDEFLSGRLPVSHIKKQFNQENVLTRQQARNLLIDLAQQAFANTLRKKGLLPHHLSPGNSAFYFPARLVPEDTLRIRSINTRRQIVGFRTVGLPEAQRTIYWHFAVSGRLILMPDPRWAFSTHVLFSDDGTSIWEEASRLHRARRRFCRNWWNDKWRDLLLSVAMWLADEGPHIRLRMGAANELVLASTPIVFRSPVTYQAPDAIEELTPPELDEELDDSEESDRIDSSVA